MVDLPKIPQKDPYWYEEDDNDPKIKYILLGVLAFVAGMWALALIYV